MNLPKKLPLGATASDYTELEVFNAANKRNLISLGFVTAKLSSDNKSAAFVVPQSMIAGVSKFQVRAVHLDGTGEDGKPVVVYNSANVSVILTGSRIPNTPVPVDIPAPVGFVTSGTTDTSVSLQWNAMTGLPSDVEISYEVRYKTGSENYSDWYAAHVTGTTATINELDADTEYDFEVRVVVNLTVFSLVSHTKAKTETAPVPVVETRTVPSFIT